VHGQKPDTRTVVVDGHEMIAVRPADFERLDASRRQVGARSARATRLHQQLQDARARLAKIEAILANDGPAEHVCEQIAVVVREPERVTPAGSPTTTGLRRRRR
jgi:hypothetical protein